MVVSEIVAATMIAVCGFKNSYRVILKGERLVRRKIRRPAEAIAGYDSFPRSFIRKVFRAGLVIAMRWEGRAKNAAQIAADARMRARKTSRAVAESIHEARHRAEHVQRRAQDQAQAMRERAEQVRKKASHVRTRAYDEAESLRKRAADVRERAGKAKERAVAAKDSVVAAKDRVFELKNRMQEKMTKKADARKFSSHTRTIVPKEPPKHVMEVVDSPLAQEYSRRTPFVSRQSTITALRTGNLKVTKTK